ncbi:hypothetical protein B0T18DRAFT_432547 [Schizothecium vesticola]|uniref:Rhodopsin domain-containing protein n=1 Tax=Schizothecium vesticola TaxID=314040 RepID=A0AA40ELA5_9PEZI|nr:hypothetical protein B0T18DRAFT_432547 [Schizothecium vesticola]
MDPDSRPRGDQAAHANTAIWVLVGVSCAFLFVRLGCRHHFSKVWWDDGVLSLSWILLLVGGALISRIIALGSATDDSPDATKVYFFLLHNTSITMTTIATSWAKVAFAITLTRIARHKLQRAFLWFVIVTANLILVPGMLATWIPACVDPRSVYRPVRNICMDLPTLQYLGGSTIVYGGIIDILLALFPWLVLRNLLLDTREKIGLTVAMSLGALTGVVVIMRVIFQFVPGDNDFDFMVFMSIFNFLEPAVTIIAQAIPMFRVLLARQTKMSTIRLTSSPQSPHTPRTPRTGDLLMAKPSSLLESEVWDHGHDRHSRDRHSRDQGYYTAGQNRKYGWAGDNVV